MYMWSQGPSHDQKVKEGRVQQMYIRCIITVPSSMWLSKKSYSCRNICLGYVCNKEKRYRFQRRLQPAKVFLTS